MHDKKLIFLYQGGRRGEGKEERGEGVGGRGGGGNGILLVVSPLHFPSSPSPLKLPHTWIGLFFRLIFYLDWWKFLDIIKIFLRDIISFLFFSSTSTKFRVGIERRFAAHRRRRKFWKTSAAALTAPSLVIMAPSLVIKAPSLIIMAPGIWRRPVSAAPKMRSGAKTFLWNFREFFRFILKNGNWIWKIFFIIEEK